MRYANHLIFFIYHLLPHHPQSPMPAHDPYLPSSSQNQPSPPSLSFLCIRSSPSTPITTSSSFPSLQLFPTPASHQLLSILSTLLSPPVTTTRQERSYIHKQEQVTGAWIGTWRISSCIRSWMVVRKYRGGKLVLGRLWWGGLIGYN